MYNEDEKTDFNVYCVYVKYIFSIYNVHVKTLYPIHPYPFSMENRNNNRSTTRVGSWNLKIQAEPT